MFIMVSLGFIMSSSALWSMNKFLMSSMKLTWQRFITFFYKSVTIQWQVWWLATGMVQTPYVNNKDVPYLFLGIWSDEPYSWWWSRTWASIALWCWRNSWQLWQWNSRQRPSNFCSSTEEILTDDVLSALPREVPLQSYPENYGIGNFIKAKTIIKVHYAE